MCSIIIDVQADSFYSLKVCSKQKFNVKYNKGQ